MREILYFALFVIVIFFGWFFYTMNLNGTDLAFQSSDGEWADSEIQFKGRNFKSITFFFHLYKEKCNKPDVVLQRLTPKPEWYEIEHWFNDYNEPKWKIPLVEGNEKKRVQATIRSLFSAIVTMH